MRRLKDHGLQFMRRRVPAARARLGADGVPISLPFLTFAAIALLVLSRLNHTAIVEMRWRLTEMVPFEPVRDAGRRLAAQVNLTDELVRLKAENQKLNMWEWRARDLERKLADLENLSKVVEQPAIPFITARVIAEQSGAFARSVIIDSGQNVNLAVGYPVISADGLIGRVVEVGPTSARVLLASDQTSRIPVVVGTTGVRAILEGDNGSEPRLAFIAPDANIQMGDDIATSGVGGMYPRGLRVGKVSSGGAAPRVTLRSSFSALDYVSVLFFSDPGFATGQDTRATSSSRDQAGLKRGDGRNGGKRP
jgi:rod shape-determining protein MreC